jgi:hypothetical protein
MSVLQAALVSIPPYKFVRPPCWFYWMYEIENCDFRVFPNSITSIPIFIQICLSLFELNHADLRTYRHDRLNLMQIAHVMRNDYMLVFSEWCKQNNEIESCSSESYVCRNTNCIGNGQYNYPLPVMSPSYPVFSGLGSRKSLDRRSSCSGIVQWHCSVAPGACWGR